MTQRVHASVLLTQDASLGAIHPFSNLPATELPERVADVSRVIAILPYIYLTHNLLLQDLFNAEKTRDVTLTPATSADLPRVLAILEDAAAWLQSRGIDQWRPGQFHADALLTSIEHQELYLAQVEGRDAATIILQWSDPKFWPPENHDTAGYIHKLAVHRSFAGQGLGQRLIDWASTRATERGKQFLRLDCMATNPSLCRFYENLGFVLQDRKVIGTWQVALYERTI
jgi:ribosomal protein S18 acetylase RimI-like enzyme